MELAAISYRGPNVRIFEGVTVCSARCFFLLFKVSKNVRVIKDFVEGGVGVDISAICVGPINYLSS